MMITGRMISIGAALLSVVMSTPSFAQDKGDRTIQQYACKDVVRESGSNREVAIAFLHGFLLGKSGSSQFNLNDLLKQTDAFLDRCIESPNDKAIDVMTTVKK
jgi:hypothetical protein